MQRQFVAPCTITNSGVEFKLVIRPDTILRHNGQEVTYEKACELLSDVGRGVTVVSGQPEWYGYGVFYATELWIDHDRVHIRHAG